MNRLILIILVLAVPVMAAYVSLKTLPHVYYSRLIQGTASHALYKLPHWTANYLRPGVAIEIEDTQDDFTGMWKLFHIRDVEVPLPAGHPLFRPYAIINIVPEKPEPQLGIMFRAPQGREMARLFLLSNGAWNDQVDAQGLFRLPIVKRVLRSKTTEQIWQDLFNREIQSWEIPWQDMVYNLYILHLRATILPKKVVSYGLLKDSNRAVVELESEDKDYRTELVMQFDNGLILNYLLVTDTQNRDAQELRRRFLRQINFRASDPSLAPLIYREFKQLSFKRQTSEEGMIYLFSAWSHNTDEREMLKEMIYFLERGEKSRGQLRPLYRYAFKRYQKTFTTRNIDIELDDQDIQLQRRIELEALEDQRRLMSRPKVVVPEVTTPRERMDEYLKKAREEKVEAPKKRSSKKLIVY